MAKDPDPESGRPTFEPPEPLSNLRPNFYSEPPTREKNVVASVYQSLLSVFDELTPEGRMEFVDLAARYAELDEGARKDLVELLPTYGALGPAQRAQLLESTARLLANRR